MDAPETVYFCTNAPNSSSVLTQLTTFLAAQGARTVQGAQDAASVIHLNPLVSSDLRLISQAAGSPNFDISYLQRILSINRQFTFGRGQTLIPHCIFASHGNEHVACVTVDPNIDRFEVSVYRTARDSMDRIWTSPITDVGDALAGGAHASESGLNLCGFVSNDGNRVLVQCGDLFSTKSQFVTSDQGAHWTPLLVHNASSSYRSHLAVCDDERIFIIRNGTPFGRGGQAEIVDVYSTRTWKYSRSWTFCFGGDQHSQNFAVVPHLAIGKPIFCIISTHSSSGRDHDGDYDRCLICSSTGQQFYVEGIRFVEGVDQSVWVSDDGGHLIHRPYNDGGILHWRLTQPTLTPTTTVALPYAETNNFTADRLPMGVTYFRFSPGGQIVTVIVANDRRIIILSFLLHNFQLVHKKIVRSALPKRYITLKVHVGKARGVSVICGAPRSEDRNGEPLGLVLGFWQVPDAYRIILSVESYFDTFSIKRSSSHGDVIHRWSIFDQSPRRVLGDQVPLTVMEISVKNYIYDQIHNQNTTVAIGNDMEMPNSQAQIRIIHITTISYPWDPRSRVAVFIIPGFPSHHSYEVVAATPAAGFETRQPFFIRILYSSGYMNEGPDTLEIIQDGSHYVLRVTRPRDATKFTVLPGMPTPRVRTTNVGHHFIFEDAKQDVLLAMNFTSTQRLSMITANFAACFWPHPVHRLQNNTVTDFGWRGYSAYNMTKLLTWLWYTRRTTDLDARGTGTWEEYFRRHCDQVFNDKSYDDSQPFFPSTFAAASFIDYISSSTTLTDEFFRRYHLSEKLLVSNSRAISCSLPATCRARPLGLLAFMRHIALASFRLTQINPVEVLGKPHDTTQRPRRSSHVEVSEKRHMHSVYLLTVFLLE